MPRRQESLLEDLIYMHWSVSVALSVIAYVALAVVLPQYCAGDSCGLAFRPLVSTLSTFAPVCRAIAADSRRTLRVTSPENAPVT